MGVFVGTRAGRYKLISSFLSSDPEVFRTQGEGTGMGRNSGRMTHKLCVCACVWVVWNLVYVRRDEGG